MRRTVAAAAAGIALAGAACSDPAPQPEPTPTPTETPTPEVTETEEVAEPGPPLSEQLARVIAILEEVDGHLPKVDADTDAADDASNDEGPQFSGGGA